MPKTFLADPIAMVQSGWVLLTEQGFAKDIGFTIWRVLGGFVLAAHPRGAARRRDGRVQAGRGVLRAVRLVRALPAGLGLHPAADPVGRHRRGAEARADLHRLVLPARADDRAAGRRHPARSGRGRVHAGRERRRHREERADPGRRAADRRDAAAGAGLGLDLRDRRRADRRVERDRAHDHRQPGAARDRPDHLRDHHDRGDRVGVGRAVQALNRGCFGGRPFVRSGASRQAAPGRGSCGGGRCAIAACGARPGRRTHCAHSARSPRKSVQRAGAPSAALLTATQIAPPGAAWRVN